MRGSYAIMPSLKILQTYAQMAPESLPSSILFKHSSKNITIFDAYPKSIFHFLILPRVQKPDPVLSNLGTLLNSGDKVRAMEVITSLSEDAQVVRKEILEEMDSRYGFKWDVWIGFHGAPSMEYVYFSIIWNAMMLERAWNPDIFIFTYFLLIFCLRK
jgi:aprataxin